MARLAVVTGHTVLGHGLDPPSGGPPPQRHDVAIGDARVEVVEAGDVVLLERHGHGRYVPAPWIDHHAHAAALASLGCDRVLALSSVGGLHAQYGVGTVVVPDDFVALAAQPDSGFRDARGHIVARFDPSWRAQVLTAWSAHSGEPPIDGGVYWQTTGPRFETPAEVRFLATFADVVGMTAGTECVACVERGLAYAVVAVIDNLANGIGGEHLTIDQFEAGKSANRDAVVETLTKVIAELVA